MHFSAAHFVASAGACENLHGHNYTVEVYIEGPLNEDGMVLDFRDVKTRTIEICKSLDHRVLLPGESNVIKIRDLDDTVEVRVGDKRYILPRTDCLVLPLAATTAELLAEFIAGKIEITSSHLLRVCVAESEGSVGCFESKE